MAALRELHAKGRLAVLGEITNQYAGIPPDAPRMEPYWANAAAGVVDVIMPDVKWCGGLLELRKVAAMVEPPETFDKGHLTIRKRPGFGITLNEKIIRQFAR